MMRLILGSKSPRRAEILSYFSIPFEQVDPCYDEKNANAPDDPEQHVQFLAMEKAKCLKISYPDAIIITADTIVYFDGKIFGKPSSEKNGFEILEQLSSEWHSVYTGLTIYAAGNFHSGIETTRILFNPLSKEEIRTYLSSLHCWDKAGAYAIQRCGHIVVNKIEGCFYNVMGLPMNTLRKLLLNAGIDLWNHLKPS